MTILNALFRRIILFITMLVLLIYPEKPAQQSAMRDYKAPVQFMTEAKTNTEDKMSRAALHTRSGPIAALTEEMPVQTVLDPQQNDSVPEPLTQTVTVQKPLAGTSATEVYNRELDLHDMTVTMIDLTVDKAGTSVKLRLTLPHTWDDAERASVMRYLFFRFFADDKPLYGFRMEEKTLVFDGFSYTVTYRNPLLFGDSLLTATSLNAIPYLRYYEKIHGSVYNGHDGGFILPSEEAIIFNGEEPQIEGSFTIAPLSALAVSSVLPQNGFPKMEDEDPLPDARPLTIWTDDWERNKELGYYEEGTSYYPFLFGSYCNTTVDISRVIFELIEAYTDYSGTHFLMHLVYPDDWTAEQRYSMTRKLYVRVYGDKEPLYNNSQKIGDRRPRRDAFIPIYSTEGHVWEQLAEAPCPSPKEIYFTSDAKCFSLENPIPADKLQIQVYYNYTKSVTLNGRTYDLGFGDAVSVDSFPIENNEPIILREIEICVSSLSEKGEQTE